MSTVPKPPKSARTPRQKMVWLAKRGYLWAAYLVARHSNKLLVDLLQRTNPQVPWKNIQFASRHA